MYFENENREFLEKYDSDSKQIEYYTEQVERIFNEVGIDNNFTTAGIKANVKEWFYKKETLFHILRNHPMWNEEAKAIIFLRDEVRGQDLSAFKRDINELVGYTSRKIIENELETSKMFDVVISLLSRSANREINEREAELINRLGYYKEMRSGMKRSRVINTVFKEYPIGDDRKIDATKFTDEHEEGDRNYLSYNKLFAKVADDTNPLKIKRITVLSVNICDFLLMSNGNSWSSCHFINSSGAYRGCYKAGTLSYSNDGTSMCFYTLPETYEGNRWYMEKKITRQLFFYENGLLLQSRLYPKGGDASGESYGDYRAVVQDIIAKCIEKPNLWKKVDDGWYNYIDTHGNTFHYRDYEEYPDECVFTYNKEMESKTTYGLHIGGDSYCVDCGDMMDSDDDNAEELQCCDCLNNRSYCYRCGCEIDDDDDAYEIDGEVYCDDCTFYCEYHNEREVAYDNYGDSLVVDERIGGHWYTMCIDAYDEAVTRCDKCDELEFIDDMIYVEEIDSYLCKTCYDEYMEEKENEVA